MLFQNKKLLIYLFAILGLSVPGLFPLFKSGFFAAHDAIWHIARFYQFHLSLLSGQIPPRWAPTLFNGLGYPAFIVNFHLPYYLMEAIYRFGFSLVDTFKILLGLSFLLSGIFSFLFLKSFFPSFPAFVGTVFFLYSPYRFATIYTRGAIGEALAIALIPLVFLFIKLISIKKRFSGPLFSLSVFFLIIAHPDIFLIFSPFILISIIILSHKDKPNLIVAFFWLSVGITASAFQTLPALFEKKFLMFDDVYREVYLGHFPSLASVFRLPIGIVDLGTPFQIGLVQWIITFLSSVLLLFERKKNNFVAVAIFFFLLGIFFMSFESLWFWKNLPLLSTVLFPWRFINLLLFSSTICAAYICSKFKRIPLIGFILIILAIFPTRHFWGWAGQIPKDDTYYKEYKETTTAQGEFTPRGISPEITNYASKKIELLSGEVKIDKQKLDNSHWQFETESSNNSTVKLALLAFPGWKVKINNKETSIVKNYKKENVNYSGLIVLNLPKGQNLVNASFRETKLRQLSDFVTGICLIFIILNLIFLRSSRHWNKIGQCKKRISQ